MNWIKTAIDKLSTKSQGEIKSRIQELGFNLDVEDTKAKGYCYCVKLDAQGNPRVNDLVEFIATKIVDYSIPKKEIDEAAEYYEKTNSSSKFVELEAKARTLFTDLDKTGEGGEMLLYVLVQEFLGYPQLISKMSLKTSGQMHYQGVDGIHVAYDSESDILSLYWGESKMYENLNDAVSACLKSLKGFLLDPYGYDSAQERDLQLITAQMTNNINEQGLEDILVRYFDKDDDLSNKLKYKGVCFIGFDSKNYPDMPLQKTSEELKQVFEAEYSSWIKKIGSKIKVLDQLDQFEIHVFLIPFPSVQDFRDHFLKSVAI